MARTRPEVCNTIIPRWYHASMSALMSTSLPGSELLLAALLFLLTLAGASPGCAQAGLQPQSDAAQIVLQMQLHNQAQTQALKHYKTLRHYQVEYRGFSSTVKAWMNVEVNYDAAAGKSFRIVSQSGSKFLLEKVLKRAVDSEKEAGRDRSSNALTGANYRFALAGTDNLQGRPAYVLQVEPLVPSKFLYRGKIWIDGADFAVIQMDVQPAKNPSFWIAQTLIHTSFAKVQGFWLPQQNRSETRVRIGGTAVFTIDYGSYQFGPESAQ
jgi:hypothetical protein